MDPTRRPNRLTPDPIRELPEDIAVLADALVDLVERAALGAHEGAVRSRQPGRYRRMDCDGRALVYLRPRQRAGRGLRVDLTGLWVRPRKSPLDFPGRSGSASLLVRDMVDVPEAARFVAEAVDLTRRMLDAESARRRRQASGLGRPRGE